MVLQRRNRGNRHAADFNFIPSGEILPKARFVFVAFCDYLKEQIGLLPPERQMADLVDDQELRRG